MSLSVYQTLRSTIRETFAKDNQLKKTNSHIITIKFDSKVRLFNEFFRISLFGYIILQPLMGGISNISAVAFKININYLNVVVFLNNIYFNNFHSAYKSRKSKQKLHAFFATFRRDLWRMRHISTQCCNIIFALCKNF